MLNSHPPLLFFSTLTLIAKATHLLDPTSCVSKSSYSQESQEPGKLMWDSPRRYPAHLQMPIHWGGSPPRFRCVKDFAGSSSPRIQTGQQIFKLSSSLICHEHRIWSWGARNYTEFKAINCWHWIYLSLPTSLKFGHNLELVSCSSSLEAGGCNILQRCLSDSLHGSQGCVTSRQSQLSETNTTLQKRMTSWHAVDSPSSIIKWQNCQFL